MWPALCKLDIRIILTEGSRPSKFSQESFVKKKKYLLFSVVNLSIFHLAATRSNSQSSSASAAVGRVWICSRRWPFKPLKGEYILLTHPISFSMKAAHTHEHVYEAGNPSLGVNMTLAHWNFWANSYSVVCQRLYDAFLIQVLMSVLWAHLFFVIFSKLVQWNPLLNSRTGMESMDPLINISDQMSSTGKLI